MSSGDTPELLKILFGAITTKKAWLDSFQLTIGKFGKKHLSNNLQKLITNYG